MITKTFEELLKGLPGEDKINDGNQKVVINLMKQVRKATLQECAKKAETKDVWWQDNGNPKGFSYKAVDRDSILNLDLNSIEIDD
jgi:hypothetical protein